jgi:lipopolysaccharide export system protein LptA
MRLAYKFVFFLILFAAFLIGTAFAAATPEPTTITSQRMEYNTEAQTIFFSGNVHVVRGDMELWSDRLTLFLKNDGHAPSGSTAAQIGISAGEIDKIIAEANVRMKSQGRHGECEKATFTMDNELLVMEGNPRLYEGRNSITGQRILFHMAEGRSEVIGAPDQPVRVIFTHESRPETSGTGGQ